MHIQNDLLNYSKQLSYAHNSNTTLSMLTTAGSYIHIKLRILIKSLNVLKHTYAHTQCIHIYICV